MLTEKLKEALRTHLFASIPTQYSDKIKSQIYTFNLLRLSSEYFVLIIINLISLGAYLSYYSSEGYFLYPHIYAHAAVILVLLALYIYLKDHIRADSVPEGFLCRNVTLIFTIVHCICECVLFYTGPHDIAALIRLCSVPFMTGAILIIKQLHILILNFFIYLTYSVYLFGIRPYTVFTPDASIAANVWINVFVSSTLISFIIYSAYINNAAAELRLNETNEKLDRLSKVDHLTGISNRRKLMQYLDNTWQHAVRNNSLATVIMFDIDFFKQYNDFYGHIAGDECLIKLSSAIQESIDLNDCIFSRYGGEEFIALIYNNDHSAVVRLADELRRKAENLKIENPTSIISPYVTVSIGVSSKYAGSVSSPQVLIGSADDALYKAKQNGRNQVVHSDIISDDFKDINGRVLNQKNLPADEEDWHSDSYFNKIMRDTGNNCYFTFHIDSSNLCVLEFSETAYEIYSLPQCIYSATPEVISNYIYQPFREAFSDELNRRLNELSSGFAVKTYLYTRKNEKRLVSIEIKLSYSESGQLNFATGFIINLEEAVQYSKFIQYQSMLNSITLLPNRMKFTEDMNAVLQTSGSGYIVLIDICRFRMINSIYSHNIGDKALFEIGTILRQLTSLDGDLYNYSIDQFITVMQGSGHENALMYMERITQYFGVHTVRFEGIELSISMKLASVAYGEKQHSIDSLMIDADIALQKAKGLDGISYTFFADADRENHFRNLTIESQLSSSVKNDFFGFYLNYQPIFSSSCSEIAGAEALLRWVSPEGETVPPLTVIPILEKNGLMPKVENWIFLQSCAQCRKWIDQGLGSDFFVQINLSASQINRDSLTSEIENAISLSGISSRNVMLEVTESSLMTNMKRTIGMLEYLKETGIRIAIDDFGTGYSSLSYLRELPVNEIKIDKSFLNNIITDDSARNFLDSVISMSKSMGYAVCAEGVENSAQLEILSEMNIDYYQGFLFSEPVGTDEFIEKSVNALSRFSGQFLEDIHHKRAFGSK